MDTASEIDCVALHLCGIFAYVAQGGVNERNAVNADGGYQYEQRQDGRETKPYACGQRKRFLHGNLGNMTCTGLC
jgi:hypothetical protein